MTWSDLQWISSPRSSVSNSAITHILGMVKVLYPVFFHTFSFSHWCICFCKVKWSPLYNIYSKVTISSHLLKNVYHQWHFQHTRALFHWHEDSCCLSISIICPDSENVTLLFIILILRIWIVANIFPIFTSTKGIVTIPSK